jgi:hypothetical protein
MTIEPSVQRFFEELHALLRNELFKQNTTLVHQLNSFYGALSTLLKLAGIASLKLEGQLATHFTVFDYIKTDEIMLSDILQSLLDPSGKHGQADRFLNLFLNAVGLHPPSPLTRTQVKREDTTTYIAKQNRRIDLTFDFNGGELGIGLENKPWAVEGEDQVADYMDHLTRKYGENKYRLIYLSGDGSKPISLTPQQLEEHERRGQLIVISYFNELITWLRECERQCQAERVRVFLRDFTNYIVHTFPRSTGP